MADVKEQLQKEGWFLSDEGVKQLSDDGKVTNPKAIIKKALDIDLRETAAPGFPEEVGRCKVEGIPGGLVVQLQKVRNVSAPKANEESGAAPRMLKLTLTDGHSTCHAVEIERIPALTLNTPPGTKILLKSKPGEDTIPVCSNFLLLNAARAEVLGGKVVHMIEKWELNRSLAKHKRGGGEDGGPPPWIPFGQKIVRGNALDKNFKSLQEKEKQANEILNPEFEAQRKDAIAEAGKAGAKKVFGGGNRQLLDHNVQQIVEFGFSIEQAENALKMSRNNVDRAIKILQKQTDGPKGNDTKRPEKDVPDTRNRDNPREAARENTRGPGKGNREGGKSRGHDEEGSAATPSKPSGRLSLFDFLEDKLPFDEKEKLHASSSRMNQERGGRGGGSQRGGRGGGRIHDSNSRPVNYERGNKAGRGRGSERRPERNPREDFHQRDENRFKERKDVSRVKDQADRGKKDGSTNGRGSAKPKGTGDNKAPRFQNQKPQLQHESTQYLGHTPSNAVSTNSTLGQGMMDWGSSLSRKVEMISMIDCENTPEEDDPYINSTWPNSQRGSENAHFQPQAHPLAVSHASSQQHPPSLQQQLPRHNDNGRSQGPQNYKSSQPSFKQNNEFRGSPYDFDIQSPKSSMGPPGGPRNTFNSNAMPKIPDFPYKENLQMSNQHMNGGYAGNSNNSGNANNLGNSRNISNPRNSGNNRNMYGGSNRTDNPQNASVSDENDGPGVHWNWKVGDQCVARYWEDERYYDAVVTGVATRTLVVRFTEYGNHEEVLRQYTIPVVKPSLSEPLKNALNSGCPPSALPTDQYFAPGDAHIGNVFPGSNPKSVKAMNSVNSHNSYEPNGVPFSGSMEFRRGGTRPYMKQANAEGGNGSLARERERERRPARAPQSMYVPPAQRK